MPQHPERPTGNLFVLAQWQSQQTLPRRVRKILRPTSDPDVFEIIRWSQLDEDTRSSLLRHVEPMSMPLWQSSPPPS